MRMKEKSLRENWNDLVHCKRACIWDLSPSVSVVRRCLAEGLRVFLIQWEEMKEGEKGVGLAEYADQYILECLEAIETKTGENQAFGAGHSLGGTFAAIFASLHPERIKGLTPLGSPLNFGKDAGDRQG